MYFFWRILDAYEMTSLADMFILIFLCNYIVPVTTLHPQKVRVGLVILYISFLLQLFSASAPPISQKVGVERVALLENMRCI